MLVVVTSQVTGQRDLLDDVLVELLGTAPPVHRRCPDCGEEHGKPVLDHPTLHVSTSQAQGLAAVAVTDAGPVGVDVERVGAASFPGFDGVARGPREDGDPTRLWTRKEAVLKATGEGLLTDPASVVVSDDWEPSRGAQLYDVPVGTGWCGAVAVLAPTRPALELRRR